MASIINPESAANIVPSASKLFSNDRGSIESGFEATFDTLSDEEINGNIGEGKFFALLDWFEMTRPNIEAGATVAVRREELLSNQEMHNCS